jgi:hypothetical protein
MVSSGTLRRNIPEDTILSVKFRFFVFVGAMKGKDEYGETIDVGP